MFKAVFRRLGGRTETCFALEAQVGVDVGSRDSRKGRRLPQIAQEVLDVAGVGVDCQRGHAAFGGSRVERLQQGFGVVERLGVARLEVAMPRARTLPPGLRRGGGARGQLLEARLSAQRGVR